MRAAFASVLIGLVLGRVAFAEPDLARAKDLYLTAEKAIADGRYADAVRDYGATYDITHDPILFYKMASAYEKAGQCDVALIYYGRYVKEARPTDGYLEMTKERVRACGGDSRIVVSPAAPPPPAPPSEPPPVEPPPAEPPPAEPPPAEPVAAGPVVAPGSKAASMSTRERGAWLLVASSIGLVTIGTVLAYSANSAESDITDLYQGFTGMPASFDDRTRATYDDLVAEGRRYERLSWVSFGLAGATAITAIILLKTGDRERPMTVTPTASAGSAGVRATLRW